MPFWVYSFVVFVQRPLAPLCYQSCHVSIPVICLIPYTSIQSMYTVVCIQTIYSGGRGWPSVMPASIHRCGVVSSLRTALHYAEITQGDLPHWWLYYLDFFVAFLERLHYFKQSSPSNNHKFLSMDPPRTSGTPPPPTPRVNPPVLYIMILPQWKGRGEHVPPSRNTDLQNNSDLERDMSTCLLSWF